MKDADIPAAGEATDNPYAGLVTLRLVRLFMVMRRAGILAQRHRFGLSEIEWRIMVELGADKAHSLNGLAEALMQDRGQLSRAVKAMVGRGLLTRNRKPGGPEIESALSPEGRELHKRMIGFVVERDQRLTADLSEEDKAVLWRIAESMIRHGQDMLDEEMKAGD